MTVFTVIKMMTTSKCKAHIAFFLFYTSPKMLFHVKTIDVLQYT